MRKSTREIIFYSNAIYCLLYFFIEKYALGLVKLLENLMYIKMTIYCKTIQYRFFMAQKLMYQLFNSHKYNVKYINEFRIKHEYYANINVKNTNVYH